MHSRALRTCLSLALICALGLASQVARVHAGSLPAPCPAEGRVNGNCTCWDDDGVLKMVCRQPVVELPVSTVEATEEGVERAANDPGQPRAGLPVAGEAQEFLTAEDRRANLEERQRSLDHSLLAVRRARFLARERQASPEELKRLDKEFATLKGKRHQNLRQLGAFGPVE